MEGDFAVARRRPCRELASAVCRPSSLCFAYNSGAGKSPLPHLLPIIPALIYMKVLLTGATGAGQSLTITVLARLRNSPNLRIDDTAGLGILRTLLVDNGVSHVTYLGRRPLPPWVVLPGGTTTEDASPTHPKLSTIEQKDFLTYPPALQETIAEHDACIWALGTSAVGMSDANYTEITVGYFDAFLDVLKAKGVGAPASPFRVVFVSGEGADSTETSRVLFKRVKVRKLR